MAIRKLRIGAQETITPQPQVNQDVTEKQGAEATKAARENARIGDHAKIHEELHTKGEEMEETQKKLPRPEPFKKFYEYPWEVQRAMSIVQQLRENQVKPSPAQTQEANDVKEKQEREATKGARENGRIGDGPAKIRLKLHIGREQPKGNCAMLEAELVRLQEKLVAERCPSA